jgi:uncharacterized damage-inducible protein DinB
MTTHELLKARFQMVRQDFDQVLARLSDADIPWRPAAGLRTVGEMLVEIANKEMETIAWLRTGVWPDGEPDAFDPETSTIRTMRARMETLRHETWAYIDSFDEAGLAEMVPCPEGWWEALRLRECPRSEILRNIAMHEWYHTGQLVIYQWVRGDDPYGW